MYARHGDPESKDIRRKGCTCHICADNGIGFDRALLAYANDWAKPPPKPPCVSAR